MKKYLMIAASLVAGSAFVNAEELNLASSKGYAWVEDGDLKTSSSLTLSGDLSSGYTLSLSDGGSFFSTTSNSRSAGTIVFTFDADKLTSQEDFTPLAIFDNNWGVGFKSNGALAGAWSGRAYSTHVTNPVSSYVESGVLTFAITAGDSGTKIFLKDSSTFWSSAGLKGRFSSSNLALSPLASQALSGIAVWDVDSWSDSQAISSGMAAVSAIPEPSAFGLLAGLGALCLVGARRRRS